MTLQLAMHTPAFFCSQHSNVLYIYSVQRASSTAVVTPYCIMHYRLAGNHAGVVTLNNTRSRWPRCSHTHKDRCTVHKHRALQQRSHQAVQPHQLRSLYMYISTYTPSLFQICSYDHSLRYCLSFCYGDRIVRCSSKTQFSMTSADRWSLRYKSSCMAYTPAMLYRRLEVLPFP